MRRKQADKTLTAFNDKAVGEGVTYAQAQIRETQEKIGRVRAPRAEGGGEPVYMKVSARNALKNISIGNE